MCLFSGAVDHVSDTHIFARGSNESQFLVYSMSYAAPRELAMVLPLPVPPNAPEDAVRFISLQDYPDFFDDLRLSFRSEMGEGTGLFRPESPQALRVLKVHDVGDFEASFVPRLEDFSRLDPRFRMPGHVWKEMPEYRDYGFAVFKLKSTHDPLRVHPMAFEFPRRHLDVLFFPTVHVHDNKVHENAIFDHMLYTQAPDTAGHRRNRGWQRASERPAAAMRIEAAKGVVSDSDYCWRMPLDGRLANRDLWARVSAPGPEFTSAPRPPA